MIEDAIIEALVKIGNHKKVLEMTEPCVAEPMELKGWMVIRTLKAQELLQNEWELYQNKGREISETPLSDKGAIHSDT